MRRCRTSQGKERRCLVDPESPIMDRFLENLHKAEEVSTSQERPTFKKTDTPVRQLKLNIGEGLNSDDINFVVQNSPSLQQAVNSKEDPTVDGE